MGYFITEQMKGTIVSDILTESQMNDYNERLMSYITEAYFGDSSLRQAQEYLSAFRADILKYNIYKGVTTNDNLIKFNREMEKIFGFYIFNLNVDLTRVMNAYTIPLGTKIGYDLKNKNKCTFDSKKGYRFDPKLQYVCTVNITYGLLKEERITDRELMAIILHEIGHNFQQVAYEYEGRGAGIFNTISDHWLVFVVIKSIIDEIIHDIQTGDAASLIVNVPAILLNIGLSANNEVEKIIYRCYYATMKEFPELVRSLDILDSMIKSILAIIGDIIGSIGYILSTLSLTSGISLLFNMAIAFLRVLNPFGLIDMKIGYDNEVFADQFAAMYGYETDMMNVFTKMTTVWHSSSAQENIDKIPILNYLVNAIWAPLDLIYERTDVHPNDKYRMTNTLEYLDQEIANTKDPRMKQYLKKKKAELNRIASAYDAIELPDESSKAVKVAFRDVFDKATHNKDVSRSIYGKTDMYKLTSKKFK